MLKNFNLLIEEVKNEITKDFRFSKASRFLNFNLSDKEKSELNKKYNEIVKDELENASKSGEKIKIYYLKDDGWSGWQPNCTIEKVFEKDGEWYCSYFTQNYQQEKERLEKRYQSEEHKHFLEMTDRTPEWNKEDMKEQLKKYHPTLPISHITTDKILDLMLDYENELKNVSEEKKNEILNNITGDLKFLIDKKCINPEKIVNLLSLKKESKPVFKFEGRTSLLEDDEFLNKFKIDKHSKGYEAAIHSSKNDSETWYYLGGTILTLQVEIYIKEGERFDINRIFDVKLSYEYSLKKGYGTNGEF